MADVIKRIKTIVENEVTGADKIMQQLEAMKKLDEVGKKNTSSEAAVTTATNKNTQAKDNNTRSSQRQLMGHLGIMFAGMALQRAMSNLTQTSKEWVGIGEIMSTTMGVVMLPATMELLENGVLPLSSALLSLGEPAQKSIGLATLALEGLGGVMAVGGQLLLGMGSLKILAPEIIDKIGGIGGALKGLAGIGLISVGVVLGVESITSEGGKSILFAFGSAIAVGLGALLLGATLTGGIVIGGIALAAIVAIKMVVSDIETEKDLKQRMEAALFGTATPAEQALRGFSPTGGQGTMVNFGNEFGQRDLPQDILDNIILPGAQSPTGFPSIGQPSTNSGFGGISQPIQITQTNSFNGFGMEQVDEQINRNNQVLTDSLRIRV